MIELKNISIDLGEFHLRDINLNIRDAEYMVLLGPTGAGKTVLVECLVGIYRPRTGSMWIDGVEITDLYPEERNIGYVPQDYALFPNMTVKQNIAYGLVARKLPRGETDARVQAMMESLGIEHLHYRLPLNLSGGERQRCALGRALITQPRVLLLDEPLSALDENLRSELAAELLGIQRRVHGTFLHVCHSFEEAAEVADRIAIMDQGRLVQVGTIAEVLAEPASLFVAKFTRTRNFFEATAYATADGCRVRVANGPELYSTHRSCEGAVTAAVRPEEIEILDGAAAAAPGVVRAKVTAVRAKPTYTEIVFEGAVPLVVHERSGPAGFRVSPGDEYCLRIPPSALKVFPAEESEPDGSLQHRGETRGG